MSTNKWTTKDWGLAQAVSYIIDSLPGVKKVGGKLVFEFREEDRHADYSYEAIQGLYYSTEGLAISNVRDLLEVGRGIRTIVLSAKEE